MQQNRRKRERQWVSLIICAALGLMSSGIAWAGFCNWGGPGLYPHLTPRQVGQVFDLKQRFMNDTAGLRKNMAVKRAEMVELCRVAEPDLARIKAKEKEINALREQLQEKQWAFWMEVRQYCPKKPDGTIISPPPGMGPGPYRSCW